MLFLFIFCIAVSVPCVSMEPLCPEKTPVTNFNISGVGRGVWYEVAKYPFPCPTPIKFMTYESRMEGDLYIAETINVNRTSPYFSEVFSKMLPDAGGDAKMSFSFSAADQGHLIDSPVLYILAVDYDKYMVPYSCVYNADKNEITEYAWILTRTKPVPGSKEELIELSKISGLDENKLIWYDYETTDYV